MKAIWPLLAVLVVGTGFMIAAGTPAGQHQIQEWLIGVPRGEEDGAAFEFSATIDPTGERPVLRTSDGKRIELEWEDGEGPMAAKTQIPGHFGASATLRFLCSSTAQPGGIGVHNEAAQTLALGDFASVPMNSVPEDHDGVLMMHIMGGIPEIVGFNEWYTLDNQFHDFAVTIEVDAAVYTNISEEPIGEKTHATHAKEMEAEDSWQVPPSQDVSVTIVTEQGTYSGSFTPDTPAGPDACTLRLEFHCEGHYSHTEGDYLRMENISYTEVGIDASRLDEELEPTWAGGSWTGVKMRIIGEGSTIRMYAPGQIDSADFDWGGTIQAPRQYSFSGLSVADMDNNLLDSLELYCTGVEEFSDGAWHTKKDTLAGWRAATCVDTFGPYSWSDEPQEGDIRLLSAVAFLIDPDSAKAHGLEAPKV